MWSNCRVYGSKCSVVLTPQALADTVQVALIPSYADLTSASLADVQMNPFAKNITYSSSRGSGRPLTNFITQHKLLGVRRQAIEDDLSGKFAADGNGADPQNVAFWNIFWETPDAANLTQDVTYNVKMTYFVELFEQGTGTFTG